MKTQAMITMLSSIPTPLLEWYRKNARTLPWRSNPQPYYVWISEIMLQQTRVEAVKPYFERFIQSLPDVQALAAVDEEVLLKLWEGLGYYSRARNLKKAAQVLLQEYGGVLPKEYEALVTLQGIGPYTAGAIASIAYGQAVPAIDGNVLRVVTRLLACDEDITKTPFRQEVFHSLQAILPDSPGDFNQSLMELGATVCLPNGMPLCGECPVAQYCQAYLHKNPLDYPTKPKKKARRIEKRTVFLCLYQGKIALCRRPEKGVLAGMWGYPDREETLSVEGMEELFETYGISGIKKSPGAKHIFSHVEWHMTGYLFHVTTPPKAWRWVDREELTQAAIPSAWRTYHEIALDLLRM